MNPRPGRAEVKITWTSLPEWQLDQLDYELDRLISQMIAEGYLTEPAGPEGALVITDQGARRWASECLMAPRVRDFRTRRWDRWR